MAGESKRFRKVLHIREVERSITQSELAERMQEEQRIQRSIDEISERCERAIDDFGVDGCVISPQQLWFARQNIDMMERSLDCGRRELADCRDAIERTKDVLIEKHRNVQLMERHVEQLALREYRQMLTTEQNELDDITTMRWGRKEAAAI